ncbi:hypothetical protein CANTEDRAFT_116600 [Yamadazyma tenuis ATCC 10573]|uniref:Uncharacterized protein n=1 Tax=Candida tenuis (strain ATCC 10573 / BCRC 21748 / CBS 615 / JCM 9827 / NBRC 10315 / NRRL Y-1498 / VKM Y-70) TaxID=590646 RepID=G3BEF5_CANTC|nr:uncharacterized protein CANTEDRAFT_116600 [Yamadazyma tenuis ATCC 10573]EGV60534.1 hypothetical protein CANTEDRAFT_116600 [Yamadazyma tenuis ATCC 10573]
MPRTTSSSTSFCTDNNADGDKRPYTAVSGPYAMSSYGPTDGAHKYTWWELHHNGYVLKTPIFEWFLKAFSII